MCIGVCGFVSELIGMTKERDDAVRGRVTSLLPRTWEVSAPLCELGEYRDGSADAEGMPRLCCAAPVCMCCSNHRVSPLKAKHRK